MATVVFPDAPLKVYLTADLQIRADRRHKQLIDKGFSSNINTVLADIEARDERDMNRAVAPLKPAGGARIIDSTAMDLESVINAMLGMVHELGLPGK
jgi:cytidylate kinase